MTTKIRQTATKRHSKTTKRHQTATKRYNTTTKLHQTTTKRHDMIQRMQLFCVCVSCSYTRRVFGLFYVCVHLYRLHIASFKLILLPPFEPKPCPPPHLDSVCLITCECLYISVHTVLCVCVTDMVPPGH